jgi:hypothetical protein
MLSCLSLSRRRFLQYVTQGALSAALYPTLSCFSEAHAAAVGKIVTGSMDSVYRVDLATQATKGILTGFCAHSFIADPENSEQVWAVEKWGSQAAMLDFSTGTVLQRLTCPAHTAFYGHGAYGPDRRTLFLTRLDLETGAGHVIGFDAEEARQVADYRIAPGFLHQCSLLPDGHMLTASSGIRTTLGMQPRQGPRVAPSSLIRFDPVNGKIVNEIRCGDDEHIVSHFAVAADGSVIAASSTIPASQAPHGNIYQGRIDGDALTPLALPKDVAARARGEILSIALDEAKGVAALTNPMGQLILLLDLRRKVFDKAIASETDFGIVHDAGTGCFYVDGGSIGRLDPATGKRDNILAGDFSSAHILLI